MIEESKIKYNINDQFPTPGIDNDSQVFRDNFSTIKTSLASAKTEIDQFLFHGIRNDNPDPTEPATMNGNILSSYVSKAASDFHYHITGLQDKDFNLSYKHGLYQTVQIGADLIIGLTDFPTDTIDNYKVGKVRLHLTADLLDRHVTFMTSSALIMYNDSFPFYESNKLTIRGSSTGIATIVDIWQVNNGTSTPIIYLEYVGLFQDTSKPIFQHATVDASGTRLLMAYNESLSSVTATANKFTVMVDGIQKQVSTVTAASTTVTLIFTSAIEKGQLVTFSYDAPLTGINAIKDSIGNKAISLSNESVENLSVIDTVRPVFQSAEVSANGRTLRLLYNELLHSTTAIPANFTVSVNGAPITVDSVVVSESTVILSLGITVQALDQPVTVSYTAPLTGDNTIKDVAGNKAVDLTNRSVINNSLMDTRSPSLQTAAVNTNGDSFVLTYDEPLSTTTASKSDFVIRGTSAAISNVTASGSAVTLTMSPPIQSGQSITLNYVRSDGPNAIKDLADNRVANFTLPSGNISITNSSTIDTIPPMVSSTAIDTTGLLLAITFNEPLKTTTAGASAFTVTVAGNSRSVSTVAASGSIVTLTLASAVQTGQPVTVNYTKPSTGSAIEDTTGNKTVDFTIASGSIANGSTVPVPPPADTTPPVFSTAGVDATGLILTLIYSEAIHATTASVNDFIVKVADIQVNISSVAVVNSILRLNLANPVQQGQVVKLTYNAPSTGDNVIKDLAGNKAASIPETTITNDSSVTGGGGTNHPGTGTVTVSGTGAVGSPITVTTNLTDPEGLSPSGLSYYWYYEYSEGARSAIDAPNATNSTTYTPDATLIDRWVYVKVFMVDDLGVQSGFVISSNSIQIVAAGGGSGGNPPATPTITPSLHTNVGSQPYQPGFMLETGYTDTVNLYSNGTLIASTYGINNGLVFPTSPIGNSVPGNYQISFTLSNSYGESGQSPSYTATLPTT